MQCPGCQHENRPQAKFCEECSTRLAGPTQGGPPVASYADLQREVEHLTRALSEALEQQTATGEILLIISHSPTDVQPVLDAVAESAARLCEAPDVSIFVQEADHLHVAARHGPIPSDSALPLNRESGVGWAVLGGQTVHVADMQTEDRFPVSVQNARRLGFRTALNVPLLREGVAIGAISLRRAEAHLFAERQVALLETFAAQAVIAIENVRLFKELQDKNQALTLAHAQVTEALEQQTATSEILRVIASSPTDVQPVFDSLVVSAARLCAANDLLLLIREADALRPAAGIGSFWESLTADFRVPLVRGTVAARSTIDAATLHFADLAALSEAEFPVGRDLQRRFGHHTVLAVPLMREGVALGTIFALRFEVRPFTDQQIALLRTFADQAVIAVENAHLLNELQAKNLDLTRALEQQTATSEILRVISSSPTDEQPVFDAIVLSASRLCGGEYAIVVRYDGEMMHLAAQHNPRPGAAEPVARLFPRAPARGSSPGRAILTRGLVHIPDALEDPDYDIDLLTAAGLRGVLSMPMLRDGKVIGAISVSRETPGPFAQSQIQLLRTFADQAVIAIENVRLFKELEARTADLLRSVSELTALGDVGRAVSSTLDLETVLDTIVKRANELAGTDGCTIWEYDRTAGEFRQRASQYADARERAVLDPISRATPLLKGQGLAGRAALLREPIQLSDIASEGVYESPMRAPLLQTGYRAVLVVPLLREEELIGILAVSRKTPGDFAPEIVRLLQTFATQSALAIQNARLFEEIENKSRQLEAASRHKSEFLANMSHELRTPLNAIIGFSEVLMQRMFGDLNAKQDEYLKDIYESGRHLLSLINDILDLSKIEAGRMELELTAFDLPTAIDSALTLVRERAIRRGIVLKKILDERVGQVQADERKVRQVVLNLLSNAIKFTPEGGRIEVRAVPVDGSVEVSVTDTGVGIAPEDQEAVFEEFRQVGTSAAKQEGTGLGLALCRKFVELHGGTIWVTSAVGAGSTFTFTLPVRPWPAR